MCQISQMDLFSYSQEIKLHFYTRDFLLSSEASGCQMTRKCEALLEQALDQTSFLEQNYVPVETFCSMMLKIGGGEGGEGGGLGVVINIPRSWSVSSHPGKNPSLQECPLHSLLLAHHHLPTCSSPSSQNNSLQDIQNWPRGRNVNWSPP